MIGRSIAVASVAGALVLGPAAGAFANIDDDYPAPSPTNSLLPDSGSKAGGETPTLSSTGFESAPMAIGAGILLVAGAATVVVAARRTAAGSNS